MWTYSGSLALISMKQYGFWKSPIFRLESCARASQNAFNQWHPCPIGPVDSNCVPCWYSPYPRALVHNCRTTGVRPSNRKGGSAHHFSTYPVIFPESLLYRFLKRWNWTEWFGL